MHSTLDIKLCLVYAETFSIVCSFQVSNCHKIRLNINFTLTIKKRIHQLFCNLKNESTNELKQKQRNFMCTNASNSLPLTYTCRYMYTLFENTLTVILSGEGLETCKQSTICIICDICHLILQPLIFKFKHNGFSNCYFLHDYQ